MAASLRKFSRSIFIFLNFSVAILLLLSCANAYLDPWQWWFIALLGFGFLPLFIVNIFFLVYWIFRKSRWSILSLIVLLLSWLNFRAAIGLHFTTSAAVKNDNTIRLLTWNVHMFNNFDAVRKGASGRAEMLKFINDQDADILCFQEFYEEYGRERRKGSVFDLLAQLGYKYAVYAEDYGQHPDKFSMGTAIFSRLPIIDSLRLRYKDQPGPIGKESLLSVDIQKNGKLFRVFSTHLQSYQFGESDYDDIQKIKNVKDQTYEASKSVVRKLRLAYRNRVGQSKMARIQLDNSRLPEILAGDFNDIPNSYTYFHIKGDRQDAFVQKSWGIGRTFAAISPTLRIDYVMADKSFKILRYEKKNVPFSDHYPIIVDLELP